MYELKTPVVPPDGGYGWIVVISSFCVTFLAFGFCYSIGILLNELTVVFNRTNAEVTAVASIAFSLQCFLAPFISLLYAKFSARSVIIYGILISSVGVTLSSFAHNLLYLYISFGVSAGIGMATINLLLSVVLSFYFVKRRTIAIAIAGIGGYLGAFVFPYIVRFLIEMYGWRGAFVILGAVELNALPPALFLVPVEEAARRSKKTALIIERKYRKIMGMDEKSDRLINSSNALAAFIEENIAGCNRLDSVCETDEPPEDDQDGDEEGSEGKTPRPSEAAVTISDATEIAGKTGDELFKEQNEDDSAFTKTAVTGRSISMVTRQDRTGVTPTNVTYSPTPKNHHLAQRHFSQGGNASPQTYRPFRNRQLHKPQVPNSPPQSFATRLQNQISRISHNSKLTSFNNLYGDAFAFSVTASQIAMDNENVEPAGIAIPSRQISRQFSQISRALNDDGHEMMSLENIRDLKPSFSVVEGNQTKQDFILKELVIASEKSDASPEKPAKRSHLALYLKHFTNYRYVILFAVNVVKGFAFYTPSLFIVPYGESIGLSDSHTTLLLSLVGIGNVLMRPVAALISDLFSKHRYTILMFMFLFGSVFTALSYSIQNFYYLIFMLIQFAFVIGGSHVMIAPMLADIIPLQDLVYALGTMMAAEGVVILLGPPLLSLFPSYASAFLATGFLMGINFFILLIVVICEPLRQFYNKSRHNNDENQTIKA